MHKERHVILSLIALGRLTPSEAERLLAVSNMGREELWVLAVCLATCLAQSLPALERTVHTMLPEGLPGLHRAVMAITYWIGGVL